MFIAGVLLTGGTFLELLTEKKENSVLNINAVVVKRVLNSRAVLRGSVNCKFYVPAILYRHL